MPKKEPLRPFNIVKKGLIEQLEVYYIASANNMYYRRQAKKWSWYRRKYNPNDYFMKTEDAKETLRQLNE